MRRRFVREASSMIELNFRSLKNLSAIGSVQCASLWVGLTVVTSCGGLENGPEHLSQLKQMPQRNYGMTFDVPLYCDGNSASESLDVVLDSARRLSAFCEEQNVMSEKNGYLRCPTGLCQQEYTPGSKAVPTMKFTVSNGSGMSSMFGGYGGSSGGSTGGAVFGSRVYVTLEFNLPLARSADTLSCVNPLNSNVQTTVLNEIAKASLASKTPNCIPRPR